MAPSYSITQFANFYCDSRPYLSPGTRSCYLSAAQQIEAVIGPLTLDEITELHVHEVSSSLARTSAPETVRGVLRRFKMFLAEAWRLRLVEDPPRYWPRIKGTSRMPDSWSREDIERLYGICLQQPGEIGPHAASEWWRAWFLVAWDTSMRLSQIMRIRLADVDTRRRYILDRATSGTKVASDVVRPISEPTVAAIEAIQQPDREMLFEWPEWPASRRDFFSVFRYLCWLADVPCPRQMHGQLTHRLRRSGVTAAALVSIEEARRQAGHAKAETTIRHYIDQRQLAGLRQPAVPSLNEPSQDSQVLSED